MSEHIGNDERVLQALQDVLVELRRSNELFILANTPVRFVTGEPQGTWESEPLKEVKPATPGFERDYSAYHLPGTVYPFGRNV